MKKSIKIYLVVVIVILLILPVLPNMNAEFDNLMVWLINFLREPQTLTYTVYLIVLATSILIIVNIIKAQKK